MGFVQGEGRTQGSLFPVTLEELIPDDHVCGVIDAVVGRVDMAELGFERAEAAETGRPGYDPRDLLKVYLYGYLQQIRSSRRLESECRRNIELMWLLGRLVPDHKTIAEFRRVHCEAVTEAGAELIRFARSVGLVRGEWVAIDGSKFRAVSSARSVREREALARYLEQMEQADVQDEVVIDPSAVASALEKLLQHPEPQARFMRTAEGKAPAYNVQTAVDAEHALIVVQQVTDEATDNRSLQPPRAGTRRSSCDPAPVAPAATSARCCADTRSPVAARSGSAVDTHTDTASADPADRNQAARSRLPRHARIPTPPCLAAPQTHRSRGTHDRRELTPPA